MAVWTEYSEADQIFVARLSGENSSQSDFQTVIQRLTDAIEARKFASRKLAIMIILEPNHALPDSRWRKAAAALTGRDDFHAFLAVVTRNIMFRGVLTALDWLREKKYEDKVCGNTDDAEAWLREVRKESLPRLSTMIESVRSQT